MTQESSEQVYIENDEPTQMGNAPHDTSSYVRSPPEATSICDASEKPVREKLKKTSIASISQHATSAKEVGPDANDSHNFNVDKAELKPANATSIAEIDPSRGRPLKKRSFDGLEITDTCEDISAGDRTHSRPKGHARKRSRDVRTGEGKENRLPWGVDTTLEEEQEYDLNQVKSPRPLSHVSDEPQTVSMQKPEVPRPMEVAQDPNTNDQGTAPEKSSIELVKAPPDQEMRDSAPSPRRKRSRDQFDAETDPIQKQKIPATEGLRAQRKSDELERIQDERAGSEGVHSREGSTPSQKEPFSAADGFGEAAKLTPSAPFGSTSILLPPTADTGSVSPTKPASDTQSQKSAALFASSAFAAHASSTTSPFGTLGALSDSATTPSLFAPAATVGGKTTGSSKDGGTQSTQLAVNGGFGAFAKTSSSGFGTNKLSSFGTTGGTKPGLFGGSVFGSGFGGGASGAGQLVNFAAPSKDARLDSANGTIRPIDSSAHEGDEDVDSDDEGEGLGKDDQGGADEVDARFQHQDVETGEIDETTVLSSRASLYTFKDRAWKEGGKGVFKLNVKISDGDQNTKTGRFIMRAHQTFRVLLNAPVLKGMTIGARGKEPMGKSFQFAVLEDGKVVPHLLKLGEAESKALYHEVRNLQQSMSENR